MIDHIVSATIYRKDRNLGKAINDFIETQPKGSWINIKDGDCMFLDYYYGNTIIDVINKHGSTYKLFGCQTNRVLSSTQLLNGEFSNDFNVKKHYGKSLKVKRQYKDVVREVDDGIAGFFMLFNKDTWEEVGGFEENTYRADKMFCNSIYENGGKIGVIMGVYMFHLYRPWCSDWESAGKSIAHLVGDNPTKDLKNG